jgi:hypothetical protein
MSDILSSEEIARQYRGLRNLLEQRGRGRVPRRRCDVVDAQGVNHHFVAVTQQISQLRAKLSGPPQPVPSGDEGRDMLEGRAVGHASEKSLIGCEMAWLIRERHRLMGETRLGGKP